jgi:hypothetical protein
MAEFWETDMPDKKPHCFVIGPIGDELSEERTHADWLYKGIILPVFQKYFSAWIVERADKIATPGMVSAQIINRLHDVELVIADLSFHNANAFYEMAIRHKAGKPIIHMIRKNEKIPFDVIPHRAIPFTNKHPDDHEAAQIALNAAVQEAITEGFEPDNPIMHARGKLEFEQNATPEQKILLDQMQIIQDRLFIIEQFTDVPSDLSDSPPIRSPNLRAPGAGKADRALRIELQDPDNVDAFLEQLLTIIQGGVVNRLPDRSIAIEFIATKLDATLAAKRIAGLPGVRYVHTDYRDVT